MYSTLLTVQGINPQNRSIGVSFIQGELIQETLEAFWRERISWGFKELMWETEKMVLYKQKARKALHLSRLDPNK